MLPYFFFQLPKIKSPLLFGKSVDTLLSDCIKNQKDNVILDISELKEMKEAQSGVLTRWFRNLKSAGGTLTLVGASQEIQPVLEQSRLTDICDVYSDVDQFKEEHPDAKIDFGPLNVEIEPEEPLNESDSTSPSSPLVGNPTNEEEGIDEILGEINELELSDIETIPEEGLESTESLSKDEEPLSESDSSSPSFPLVGNQAEVEPVSEESLIEPEFSIPSSPLVENPPEVASTEPTTEEDDDEFDLSEIEEEMKEIEVEDSSSPSLPLAESLPEGSLNESEPSIPSPPLAESLPEEPLNESDSTSPSSPLVENPTNEEEDIDEILGEIDELELSDIETIPEEGLESTESLSKDEESLSESNSSSPSFPLAGNSSEAEIVEEKELDAVEGESEPEEIEEPPPLAENPPEEPLTESDSSIPSSPLVENPTEVASTEQTTEEDDDEFDLSEIEEESNSPQNEEEGIDEILGEIDELELSDIETLSEEGLEPTEVSSKEEEQESEEPDSSIPSPPLVGNQTEVASTEQAVEEEAQDDSLPVGKVAMDSGEYQCLACGESDYFLKGYLLNECQTEACPESKEGWHLVFKLF